MKIIRRIIRWWRLRKIYKKCGLQNPKKYMENTGGRRGSGKTTQMLIYTLLQMWEDKDCLVITHNQQYADDLKRKIKEMAAKIGIKKGRLRVESISAGRQERPQGFLAPPYYDHYIYEKHAINHGLWEKN